MSYYAMEKAYGKLRCILLSERTSLEGCILYDLSVWHSKKGRTMETIRRSVVARNIVVWGEGEKRTVTTQDFLGPWKYSVWYHNDGYMSFTLVYAHWMYNTMDVALWTLNDYDLSR